MRETTWIVTLLLIAGAGVGLKAQTVKTAQPGAGKVLAQPSLLLEVRRSEEQTKGDIYIPAEWVTKLAIPNRAKLAFRFRTTATGSAKPVAASAEWRVYEGPPLLNDISGKASNLRASGPAGPIPLSGKIHQAFDIDLSNVLPATPNNKTYYVQIVARDTLGKYMVFPSPSVAVKYETSTWGTKLPDIPIIANVVQKGLELQLLLRSSNKPPRNLSSVPKDLRITLVRLKVIPPVNDVWWKPAAGIPILRLKPDSVWNASDSAGAPGKLVSATLPDNIVGGEYKLRVESSALGYPSAWTMKSIAWVLPRPRYTVEYKGLRSLEETDQLGADDLRVFLRPFLPASALGFVPDDEFNKTFVAKHDDVDEDEFHPAAVTLVTPDNFEKAKKGFSELLLRFELRESIDQVGVGALRINEDDLRSARVKQGGHIQGLIIEGLGGRFRLRFGVKAEPEAKGKGGG